MNISYKNLARLRFVSQAFFFLLFIWLISQATFQGKPPELVRGKNEGVKIELERSDSPVELFFELDPLPAVLTLLSRGIVYDGLIIAFGVIILSLFFGRFFCGWICPFGAVHQAATRIFHPPNKIIKQKSTREEFHANRYRRVKYYLLFIFLGAALLGSSFGGVFDPLSILYRGLVIGLGPALEVLGVRIFHALGSIGVPLTTGPLGEFYKTIMPLAPPRFEWAALSSAILIGLVAANLFIPRFWCRVLCPTGALLGLAARFSLFGFKVDHGSCNDCGFCLGVCHGGAGMSRSNKQQPSECLACFNCARQCPKGSVSFGPTAGLDTVESSLNLGRRRVLTGFAAGLTTPALLRSGTSLSANFDPQMIRPPGSVEEEEFLAACIRCGECMKICPTNALQPTILQAGLEGIFSPTLVPRIGYCSHTCTLCSSVCPTGAINKLDLKTKIGDKKNPPIKIGAAFFNTGRCLPHAFGINCIVCEEHCPVSPKAIELRPADFIFADGKRSKVLAPYLRPERCIGCGSCEFVCPVVGEAAVRVYNVGETRSRKRGLLLPGQQAPTVDPKQPSDGHRRGRAEMLFPTGTTTADTKEKKK